MSVHQQLRQVLAELELCSQVAALNMTPSGRDAGTDVGGNRPTGGIDRGEDRAPEERDSGDEPDRGVVLRSAEHFKHRLANAHSERAEQAILQDARRALAAHRRAPKPKDLGHPMPGDPQWKRWVAESKLPAREIARKCGVSRQYVEKVRKQWCNENEAA